jgi:uncharacterized tellurite resistance protein B-like protein
VSTPFALTLGRVLIASAWADGELSADERIALEDLLFSMPDLDADTWRALRAELDRPFDAAHRETLVRDLEDALGDADTRLRAREALQELMDRVGPDSDEGRALADALAAVDAASAEAAHGENTGGWIGRFRRAFGGSLGRHADRLRQTIGRENEIRRALEDRLGSHWPDDEPYPDETTLRRLALGAGILAHLVRLDDVVESGERQALIGALTQQWGLGENAATLVGDLALDEAASGIDLHTLMRDFIDVTDEDERQRFLAAVFLVAAGDGRASFDEIEEVRRIGRGLLLSHRHFIAAKLSLPDRFRDT